jgi:hypothetical protein
VAEHLGHASQKRPPHADVKLRGESGRSAMSKLPVAVLHQPIEQFGKV